MKTHNTKGWLGGATKLMSVLAVWMFAGSSADAAAAKVTMLMTDGSRQTGFIQDSNGKQILFAYTPQQKGSPINRSTIKTITFQEEANLMGRGRNAFKLGAYEPAAQIFGKVATDYSGVAALDRNFASEARFFQMESLRRLGKYDELGALLETKSGKSIAKTQDKLLGDQVQLMKMWAAFSGSKWDVVKAGLKFYEVPQVGDAKMLPAPVFKKMSRSTMIQLSYIRGKMYEQEKKVELALEDYYRAFTITYGNQPTLANEAMLSAMAIEAADPKVKELQSKQWQLEGLAYYYKNGVGAGEIPAEYTQYAVLPDIPVGPVVPKPEEKKEGEGDAKAPEAGDKKAPDTKKAPDGKKPEAAEDKKKAEAKPEKKVEEKKAK
ncbi:MAG: hypothetical protein GXP30_12340 [Verrucomicrobia bacterium]|nr:hypothetical protein [Verrucomicrobiota bacterium]